MMSVEPRESVVAGFLAVAAALAPISWAACVTTTEADTVADEQRAYARCLDACRNEPSEHADDGPDEMALRVCRDDCNAEYSRDERNDGSQRHRGGTHPANLPARTISDANG